MCLKKGKVKSGTELSASWKFFKALAFRPIMTCSLLYLLSDPFYR